MRRELRVVAAPVFENDATVVDRTVSERARDEMMHEATTIPKASKPQMFEDLPTTVWVPGTGKPAAGGSAIRPSARRLRSVETGPNVQIATEYQSFSARDEVTRIEAPPPSKPREDTTAPGVAQRRDAERRRRLPIRIAIAAMLTLLAGMGGVAVKRHNAQRLAAQPAATATTHATPVSHAASLAATAVSHAAVPVSAGSSLAPAPTPTNPVPAPVAAAPLVTTPAVSATSAGPSDAPKGGAPVPSNAAPSQGAPSNDEQAAVDAVQSGNVARAARLYAALATAHPGNDAYREAARILSDASKESAR